MSTQAARVVSFWHSRLRVWPLAVRHGLDDGGSNSPPPSGTLRGSPTEPLKSVPPEHRIARRSTIGFVAVNLYEPSALAFSDSAPDPDLVGRRPISKRTGAPRAAPRKRRSPRRCDPNLPSVRSTDSRTAQSSLWGSDMPLNNKRHPAIKTDT